MNDKMFWKIPYGQLLGDLRKFWKNAPRGSDSGPDPKQKYGVTDFVYGYSSFSGAYSGFRVKAIIDTYDHSRKGSDNHVELLCLNLKVRLQGFITVRHRDWLFGDVRHLSARLECPCGDTQLDQRYRIEARFPEDKTVVTSDAFRTVLDRIDPFASFGVEDVGLRLTIPLESDKQLTVSYLCSRWNAMLETAHMSLAAHQS